jgi:hypothetical protein
MPVAPIMRVQVSIELSLVIAGLDRQSIKLKTRMMDARVNSRRLWRLARA